MSISFEEVLKIVGLTKKFNENNLKEEDIFKICDNYPFCLEDIYEEIEKNKKKNKKLKNNNKIKNKRKKKEK